MIKDIYDLQTVANNEQQVLSNVRESYLSDAGKAAREAYQAIHWYSCFFESLTELIKCEDYLALEKIEGKHPEYYAVLRRVNNKIRCIVY